MSSDDEDHHDADLLLVDSDSDGNSSAAAAVGRRRRLKKVSGPSTKRKKKQRKKLESSSSCRCARVERQEALASRSGGLAAPKGQEDNDNDFGRSSESSCSMDDSKSRKPAAATRDVMDHENLGGGDDDERRRMDEREQELFLERDDWHKAYVTVAQVDNNDVPVVRGLVQKVELVGKGVDAYNVAHVKIGGWDDEGAVTTKTVVTVPMDKLRPVQPRLNEYGRVQEIIKDEKEENDENDYRGMIGIVVGVREGKKGKKMLEVNLDLGDDSLHAEKITTVPASSVVQIRHQGALSPAIVESMKQKHGRPCFTWKLGSPVANQSLLDCMADRVGGLNGFAQYRDKADHWPCDRRQFLVCQVNLATIPAKMQRIVGNRGLLQIFQSCDSDDWSTASFVRVLPPDRFSDLVPCAGLPFREDPDGRWATPQQHAPTSYPIVGWTEHLDMPQPGDDDFNNIWEEHVNELTVDVRAGGADLVPLTALHRHKFGGFGSWSQGGGGSSLCKHCGGDHLAQIQFQLVDDYSLPDDDPDKHVLTGLPLGDNGTVQHRWCAQSFEGTHSVDGACG